MHVIKGIVRREAQIKQVLLQSQKRRNFSGGLLGDGQTVTGILEFKPWGDIEVGYGGSFAFVIVQRFVQHGSVALIVCGGTPAVRVTV